MHCACTNSNVVVDLMFHAMPKSWPTWKMNGNELYDIPTVKVASAVTIRDEQFFTYNFHK